MVTPAWAVALLGASVLGFLDALYFWLADHRLLRADARWIPRICRLDDAACARLLATPYARVLGLPNWTLGLGWYATTGLLALGALRGLALPYCALLLLASSLTVLFSAYLAYVLLGVLHVRCALCFLGHALNVGILLLLALGCAQA